MGKDKKNVIEPKKELTKKELKEKAKIEKKQRIQRRR